MSKPVPGSYIDTQGMGGPMSPEDAAKAKKQKHKPVRHNDLGSLD